MEAKNLGKSSTGLEANVAALAAYAVGWITGLLFFIIEKENTFVRFHAMQSIVVFGALSALGVVLSFLFQFFIMLRLYVVFQALALLANLIWLSALVLWVILMVKAYQGEKFKLPFVGNIVENILKVDSAK